MHEELDLQVLQGLLCNMQRDKAKLGTPKHISGNGAGFADTPARG